jgi:hypothetical protein
VTETIVRKTDKDSVEILFPDKPSDKLREEMKDANWRYVWHGASIWYKRNKVGGDFETTLAEANELAAKYAAKYGFVVETEMVS